MTEFELFKALRPHYPSREYALLPQTANGTGAGAFRHCDALALSLWPSRGLYLHGFEIKSYRGDWVRELRDPEKAEEIGQHCNHWWIIASGPFVKADELPKLWGLMVWDENKQALVKKKAAPFRKALKPDLAFVAAILRKAQEVVTPEAALAEARAEGLGMGLKEGRSRDKYALEQYEELKRKVREFEKASGVKITGWGDAEEIGAAVNVVLNGTVARERERLLAIATRIVRDLAAPSEEAASQHLSVPGQDDQAADSTKRGVL